MGPGPAARRPRPWTPPSAGGLGRSGVAHCVLPQDPLSSLERELALQLQIAEAARRLCREGNLGRQARRQRKHAVQQEEKKLRDLQRCLGEWQRGNGAPPTPAPGPGEQRPVPDPSVLSSRETCFPGPPHPILTRGNPTSLSPVITLP